MIKRIFVVPRMAVENWINSVKTPNIIGVWAIVSIYEDSLLITMKNKTILQHLGCGYAMSSRFDDITAGGPAVGKASSTGRKFILFDEIKAHAIISFINHTKDKVDTLVIHCAAGISRSGAVGLWACRYLKLNEKEFFHYNKFIQPNPTVLKILSVCSGMDYKYINTLENIFVNPCEIFT